MLTRSPSGADVATAVGYWQEVVRLAPDGELAKAAREHLDKIQASGALR